MKQCCKNCKITFDHVNAQKYCSKDCRRKGREKDNVRNGVGIFKECPICSSTYYTTKRLDKKFCSHECMSVGVKQERDKKRTYVDCPMCGKEFYYVPHFKRKYCSKKCATEASKTSLNPLRRRVVRVCLECSKEFEINRYMSQQFCNQDCFISYVKKNGSLNPKKEVNLIDKECEYCREIFKVHPYRKDDARFCSQHCMDEIRRDKLNCPTCKKVFKAPKHTKRVFCSDSCARKGVGKRKSKFFKSVFSFCKKEFLQVEDEVCIRLSDKKYYVDIVLQEKIVIECHGDYWHCNPKKFSEDYFHTKVKKTAKEIWERDAVREQDIKSKGYILIILWESDWNKDKEFFNELRRDVNEIYENS